MFQVYIIENTCIWFSDDFKDAKEKLRAAENRTDIDTASDVNTQRKSRQERARKRKSSESNNGSGESDDEDRVPVSRNRPKKKSRVSNRIQSDSESERETHKNPLKIVRAPYKGKTTAANKSLAGSSKSTGT